MVISIKLCRFFSSCKTSLIYYIHYTMQHTVCTTHPPHPFASTHGKYFVYKNKIKLNEKQPNQKCLHICLCMWIPNNMSSEIRWKTFANTIKKNLYFICKGKRNRVSSYLFNWYSWWWRSGILWTVVFKLFLTIQYLFIHKVDTWTIIFAPKWRIQRNTI